MDSQNLNQGALPETMSDKINELQDFFAAGGSVRMLADVNLDDLEQLYAYACQLFEAGDFEAAKRFYFLLACVDHWNFDYWYALGLCYQRSSQHEEAIFCFSRSGMVRMDDPRSSYLAGMSYHALGNKDYAIKAYNAAIKWCGEQVVYQELRERINYSLTSCVQEETVC